MYFKLVFSWINHAIFGVLRAVFDLELSFHHLKLEQLVRGVPQLFSVLSFRLSFSDPFYLLLYSRYVCMRYRLCTQTLLLGAYA